MISWLWLLLALLIGGAIGLFVASLNGANRKSSLPPRFDPEKMNLAVPAGSVWELGLLHEVPGGWGISWDERKLDIPHGTALAIEVTAAENGEAGIRVLRSVESSA